MRMSIHTNTFFSYTSFMLIIFHHYLIFVLFLHSLDSCTSFQFKKTLLRTCSRLQRGATSRCRNDGQELDVDATQARTADGIDPRQLHQLPVLVQILKKNFSLFPVAPLSSLTLRQMS
jgi:hypothetical protein